MKIFNNWLKTSRSRLLVVVAAMISIAIAIKFAQGTVAQSWISGLFVSAISLILFSRFWIRWKALSFPLMRYEMRVIRGWRKFFQPHPIVRAFHLLAIAFCFLTVAVGVVIGMDESMQLLWVAGFILAMAGVCEMATQTTRLLKKAWAPILGKVLVISLGAAITAIALSQAKQLVHSLSPIDTKYFVEFTTLLTAIYLPMVFLTTIGVGMGLYASCQMLVLIIFTFGSNLMIQSRAVLGDSWMEKRRMFWHRIREGKRPPGNVLPPPKFLSEFEVSMFMSPLSKIILAWMLVHGVEFSAKLLPSIAPWLKSALVKIEYRAGSTCQNIDEKLSVVYMDDGNVSVARRDENSYTFKVEACEYYKKQGER